ncbi:hypothetical protein CRE_11452 [Caenorhabditis remanei]|uniref:DUF38 domain-containing protein n=1 Tax=Caenorhabditis remanei TaxID=31234 RepID=E3NBD9_CAERE|nr:hypothetical protein CRE_11452 [Caenorhabditis remanei]
MLNRIENFIEIIEFIESEQCQSAKMLYIDSPKPTSKFPLDALFNCPRFSLKLGGRPADGLKSNFLKRLMKYGEDQKCVLYISEFRGAPNRIMKYFDEPEAFKLSVASSLPHSRNQRIL